MTKTEVPEVSNISNSEQKALFDSKILQWPSGATIVGVVVTTSGLYKRKSN